MDAIQLNVQIILFVVIVADVHDIVLAPWKMIMMKEGGTTTTNNEVEASLLPPKCHHLLELEIVFDGDGHKLIIVLFRQGK